MNDNVNEYIESKYNRIDIINKKSKKSSIKAGIKTFFAVAGIMGFAALIYNLGIGSTWGCITFATTVIINSALKYKEAYDTRKCIEKEKKYLKELKDRENILFEEVHMEKTKSINSHRLSIESKDDKHKSIGSVMDTLMSGIFFSSGITVINPSFVWLPIAEMLVYIGAGAYKAKIADELAKEHFERKKLMHDIEVDNILRKDNGEEVNENEVVSELEGAKIDIILIPVKDLSEKERMAEMLVEDMANQPSGEDEKNKVNIKK